MCVCLWVGLRLILGVFSDYSPLYFLRQGLLLELTATARMASQLASAVPCLPFSEMELSSLTWVLCHKYLDCPTHYPYIFPINVWFDLDVMEFVKNYTMSAWLLKRVKTVLGMPRDINHRALQISGMYFTLIFHHHKTVLTLLLQ